MPLSILVFHRRGRLGGGDRTALGLGRAGLGLSRTRHGRIGVLAAQGSGSANLIRVDQLVQGRRLGPGQAGEAYTEAAFLAFVLPHPAHLRLDLQRVPGRGRGDPQSEPITHPRQPLRPHERTPEPQVDGRADLLEGRLRIIPAPTHPERHGAPPATSEVRAVAHAITIAELARRSSPSPAHRSPVRTAAWKSPHRCATEGHAGCSPLSPPLPLFARMRSMGGRGGRGAHRRGPRPPPCRAESAPRPPRARPRLLQRPRGTRRAQGRGRRAGLHHPPRRPRRRSHREGLVRRRARPRWLRAEPHRVPLLRSRPAPRRRLRGAHARLLPQRARRHLPPRSGPRDRGGRGFDRSSTAWADCSRAATPRSRHAPPTPGGAAPCSMYASSSGEGRSWRGGFGGRSPRVRRWTGAAWARCSARRSPGRHTRAPCSSATSIGFTPRATRPLRSPRVAPDRRGWRTRRLAPMRLPEAVAPATPPAA